MFSEHPYNVCKMIKMNISLIVMYNQDKMWTFLNVQNELLHVLSTSSAVRCMQIVRKIKHKTKS